MLKYCGAYKIIITQLFNTQLKDLENLVYLTKHD